MNAAASLARVAALSMAVACTRERPAGPSEAKRIVSLGPATTEILFAVGAGDRVVGRSSFCDYPEAARRLPAVGGMEPDVEAILALSPDLVVGPSGGWSSRLSTTLHARGIATWFPDEIQTLAGVDGLVTAHAARAGHPPAGRDVVASVDAAEAAIDRAVAAEPRRRVLLAVGVEPIVVAGPGGFADELLRRAGGDNVVTVGGAWPTLGFERVVEIDPDVMVDGSLASPSQASRIARDAPGWSGVRAVREGHVVVISDERVLRPGPRIAEGLAILARALHLR